MRARLLAGVLFLIALLSGCSQHISRSELPTNLRPQQEIPATPFFAQQRYQCGPAALAMVLQQRGVAVVPEALVSRVYLPEREGSVATEMVATARSYSLLVYELPHKLSALLQEIEAGNPVLVLQNLGLSWLPKWHYAVVVGYDLNRQELTLRSGLEARHQVSMALFERTWQRAGRWGVVVLRPGELPASADSFNYLKAAYGLEQVGHSESALLAYRSGVTQWPAEQDYWLALANLEYRLEQYKKSEQTLRRGLNYHSHSPAVWNNFAYTLSAQGCRERALEAVNCAIALSQGGDDYRDSYRELSATQQKESVACQAVSCPIGAKP